jgi:predicted PurR-regulated permease PerM
MTAHRWRVALWLSMLALVVWVAWSARLALFPFAVGALIAYAVTPVVDRLASLIPARTRQHDKIRRGVVVLLIYVAFFGSLTGIGVAVVPVAIEQTIEFFDQLPEIAEEARAEVTQWVSGYRAHLPEQMRDQIDGYAENLSSQAAEVAGDLLTGTIERVTGAIPVVVGFLIVPFWMFYALRDRHFVERNFMRAVPESFQPDILNIARIGDFLLGRYIRAQLLLALIVGVSIGVAMTLLGVPFSIGLGLWAGITEMIPILGPWLGAIAGILVVLATDPGLVVWVALIYFGVQQVENNILVPRIQGQAVDIHPAMIITLLAVAASTVGLIGMLFVVPLVAILRELFWYADRRLGGVSPKAAFDESHVGQRRRDRALDAQVDEPDHIALEDAAVEIESGSSEAAEQARDAAAARTDAGP